MRRHCVRPWYKDHHRAADPAPRKPYLQAELQDNKMQQASWVKLDIKNMTRLELHATLDVRRYSFSTISFMISATYFCEKLVQLICALKNVLLFICMVCNISLPIRHARCLLVQWREATILLYLCVAGANSVSSSRGIYCKIDVNF
ncbi:hypothetical protein ZWY2020_042702 [Hordeum vulgare]|nr:hypothetical protein ZWY2020_042702 [Hordeum vulgare]